MSFLNPVLWLIAMRSLWQHRTRSILLGLAIAIVTALLVSVTGLLAGMRSTMLTSATTLMSGHVNVAGFFKPTTSQAAPVVTHYKDVQALVKAEIPQVDYIVQRGRGFAKLVGDSGSLQTVVGGIDITKEEGFRKVVVIKEGSLEGLKRKDGLLLFEQQATRLGAKVGDKLTLAAPTPKGTNNTYDVTLVAIAANVGLLSSIMSFVNDQALRDLYQLNDDTTGALLIYLKDIEQAKVVQTKLRDVLGRHGYAVMEPDGRPFFMKFDQVNREDWTGQKLDVTTWDEEVFFVQYIVMLIAAIASVIIFVLVVIIAVGIMNTMWITIRERTREIGTLRAVGMQRRSVLAMFVTEGFLLGVLGTTAGIVLGLVLSWSLTAAHIALPKGAKLVLMSEHLVLTPPLFWVVFSLVFITGIITAVSLIPSYLAARLKPITAMSHVG